MAKALGEIRPGGPVLLLGNDVTAAVLTMPDAIAALEGSYGDLATGEGVCRPRIDLRFPAGAGRVYQWGTMEGGSARTGYAAIRMKSDLLIETGPEGARTQEKYCVTPGRYCGLVLLLDIRSGEPLALLNDGLLQHLRVGADSALGARYAARPGSRVLGLLGSGGMARSHLEALLTVLPLERVQVYSPTRAHREEFAAEARERYGLEAVAVADAASAHRGADLVAGCTDAVGEVIFGEHLAPGTHITCVGGRLDRRAVERLDVWLRLGDANAPHSRPSWATDDEYVVYRARPDDPVWPRHRHGHTRRPPQGPRRVGLRELLDGTARARTDDRQITFSERGNIQGAQFHAVAALIYERARERGLGREIPRDWLLQDIRD
ncbi:ornithine cyclodeaminase family protein [Streptomyces malaysiensis]|uniref:ornithine cyclodeaminase family protein n=1 Tax=Streptomyces malaysiensis TaxID=92644 RepID=UPI0011B0C586|nr:ornithine cyclodeaminase family protein [Streptomyces malaysiensis]